MKATATEKVFNATGFLFIVLLALLCLLPFWLMAAGSLSDNDSVVREGYGILPRGLTLQAYRSIFEIPERIARAYVVTILTTFVTAALGLLLISMGGYVLNRKDFRYRNRIAFSIYFTTLFSGGLIPWYILCVRYLHLKDTYLALVLPMLMSPFYILLMRNYMKSIPDEVVESAKIDGAGDFRIYLSLILPLSTPALATLGLFLALGSWNDWFLSSIFLSDRSKYKLQYLLYQILSNIQFLKSAEASMVDYKMDLPTETVKLATAVLVTGPVILFYPMVQKYFVRGIMIGAVKG